VAYQPPIRSDNAPADTVRHAQNYSVFRDHPEASLLITPWDESRLGDAPSLTQEQAVCFSLEPDQLPLWMLALNPFADSAWVTANIRAPVAITMEAREVDPIDGTVWSCI